MSVTVEFDWDVVGDAELACAAAAGDRAAFAGIYDRYADRLYDFCMGMVGDRDAADCVQEAFCMAVVDLPTLRDPDKLRPWLYAIARHQALRTLRARQRETTSDELPDEPSAEAGPDALAARNELATLVAQAEGGISDRDREVLNLAYRHGLTGAELAQALGVSNEAAKKMVQRLRDTVGRSLGALLIARQAKSGHNACPELATIVADWDGQFTILVRKRISRHIESCTNCDDHRGRLVNPKALLGASPVLLQAPSWLRAHTLTRMQPAPPVTTATAGMAAHTVGHLAARLPILTSRFALWAAAVVAVPAVALGVTAGWPALHSPPVQVSPAPTATSTSQVPTTSAPESNVPTPQPNTPVPPSAGPASSDDSNSTNQDSQPTTQAPAPAATVAPSAPTVAPTTHVAPASVASTPPAAPPVVTPPKPRVKHCADGETVAATKPCPAPQAPPQAPPTSQAPAPPKCSHVAVPGTPQCGRAAPASEPGQGVTPKN